MSRYIPGLPHIVFVESLKGVPVEEALPEGEKRKGWAGVRHALTSRWKIRKGEGE